MFRALALTLTITSLTALPEEPKRPPPVIIIDPGHGGAQEGAIGPAGLLEKNVCLEIAGRVKKLLEKNGATVHLTRERDEQVHLADRVEFANKQSPDLFVSIHANSMPTRRQRQVTSGIETYFLSASATDDNARRTADRENAESLHSLVPRGEDTVAFILADLARSEAHVDSSRLAYSIHQKIIAGTGAQDRGVQQAPFYVLMGVSAPAVLVEVGFISHPEEGKKLSDPAYQEVIAGSIVSGVTDFLATMNEREGKTLVEKTPP
ncbi:MAG: N-acetylmuramoyl-L-alanine amidase [Myxococcaceae bacterium]